MSEPSHEPDAEHAVSSPDELAERLRAAAAEDGWDLFGIAPAVQPPNYHRLLEWIRHGHAADMEWIPKRTEAYSHPDHVLPEVRSVIMLGQCYDGNPPLTGTDSRIARYASFGKDYHDLLKTGIRRLAKVIQQHAPAERTRAVVDTAPLPERDFARLAGLGWYGKNTMLISRTAGSWFFLGALLTTAELPYSEPYEKDYCGTCTRCLEACPTDAFPEPYVLDSNRCISYLTIERRKDSIPEELREGMGEWVFGCDICQEVCPWNRFSPDVVNPDFKAAVSPHAEDTASLLKLTDAEFRRTFRGTPIFRTGRSAFVRNVAVSAGNSGRSAYLPALEQLCEDPDPIVREAALWAVSRLQPESAEGPQTAPEEEC